MNYKKLFGFGAIIWAVAYLVATAFVGYRMMDSVYAELSVLAGVVIATYFAAKNIKAASWMEALKYSVVWVLIGLVLDLALTVPFTGTAIYSDWQLWVSYLIILILPLFLVRKTEHETQSPRR